MKILSFLSFLLALLMIVSLESCSGELNSRVAMTGTMWNRWAITFITTKHSSKPIMEAIP